MDIAFGARDSVNAGLDGNSDAPISHLVLMYIGDMRYPDVG